MFRLVRKDLLLQRKSFFIALAYAAVIFASFSRTDASKEIFNIGSIAIAYLFISYSLSYDDKNNSLVILNSLPVKREEIVIAKYISLAVFGGIGIVIMSLFGFLVKLSGLFICEINISSYSIMKIFIILLAMYSLFFPLYFKFGYLKLNIVNMFMFFIAIFGIQLMNYISSNFKENALVNLLVDFLSNSSQQIIYLAALASVLIITALSASISVKIYNSRNL